MSQFIQCKPARRNTGMIVALAEMLLGILNSVGDGFPFLRAIHKRQRHFEQ